MSKNSNSNRRKRKKTRDRAGTPAGLVRGIREVSTGVWNVRAQVTNLRTGRVVDRTVMVQGDLQRAVRAKLDLVDAIRNGELERREIERISVAAYAIRWQTRRAAEGLAPSTTRSRADILVDHILPFLGSYDVRQLRLADLLAWRDDALQRRTTRSGRPYSPVTINGWWRVLKAMLRKAWGELEISRPCPANSVEPLPEDSVEDDNDELDRTLVEAEVVVLLDELRRIRPDVWPLAVLGFATGMRHCSLSALQWRDVDWERGRIRVRRSHVKGLVQGRTKTKGTRRWVAVLPGVLDVLRAHRRELVRRQVAGLDTGWVFPSASGKPFHTSSVSDALQRAAKAAGVGRIVSTKTFRRTWNTLAILDGIDPTLIRANTGHSTDGMTDLYGRFRTEHMVDVQERVVGFLGGAVGAVEDGDA